MPTKPVAKLATILKRMSDLDHQEVEKEFIGAFYGSHGVGKTSAAQALAQKLRGTGRILFLDSADGWVSLDNIKPLKRNTDLLQVTDPRELMVIANALRNRMKIGDYDFSEYSVVVLDEVSSWFTDVLHSYVREQTNTPDDQDLPEIEGSMYAAPQAAFLNLIKVFHKTPGLHVIMVAHEQDRAIKGEKGASKITPSLSPKLMAGIAQLSHVVARFEARKDPKAKDGYRREAQVLPTRYVEAKTRIGGLDVKEESTALVRKIADWISDSRQMAEDLASPEPQVVAEEPDDDEPGDEDEDYELSEDEED